MNSKCTRWLLLVVSAFAALFAAAADFAIRSGTVVTNMPGQAVVLDGSPLIGHRDTAASPTLDI